MIRIERPAKMPAILNNRGQREKEVLCNEYDSHSVEFINGIKKFPTADNKIYASKSVTNILKKCQYNKCCYSEAKFVRDYVPVEHFRPKGAIGTQGSNRKQYPGYYWLAYEWTNLLLCKPGINSKKTDQFPLIDDKNRAKNHHDDITKECPLFIDPAAENPREHVRFHNDEPYGLTERGKYTVELLLRHPDLDEDRRTYFQRLNILKKALEVLVDNNDNAEKQALAYQIQAELNAAILADAEYSSMATDLLIA